jgi:hypothetical protein
MMGAVIPSGKGELSMFRYLVIHTMPPNATQDQVIAAAQKVVASLPPEARWLNSWAAGEAEKMFCEWEAQDEEALHAALEPVKELFPVEALYLVTWIDPAWYESQT